MIPDAEEPAVFLVNCAGVARRLFRAIAPILTIPLFPANDPEWGN
jgi:hypothetical protein